MNEIEDIKSKIDIVDFIGQYLTLKKAGTNYKACCPFHSEKTPSFMVSPEKQIYRCFGCSVGGDVIDFLMRMENLEFPEALEMLADRAGIVLQKTHKTKVQYQQEKDEKTQLYKINDWSAKVFHKIFLEHVSAKEARIYLEKRKVKLETIKDFKIGYAPEGKVLAKFLRTKGFSEKEIQEAGSPDRFFKRIIFPIFDTFGNVIGFTGRTLDNAIQPKYLNTPETKIFHKGHILYGLNLAKNFIREKKQVVLVEGQMDVISSYQAGVKNVVASSGTALTLDHLKILGRFCQNMIFAFDQDEAGENAAKKAIEMAISTDLNAKVVVMPEKYKDAGEIIEEDEKVWNRAVENSVPAIDWYFEKEFTNKENIPAKEKKEIAKKLLPIIKIIPDKIEQEHYIKLLAKRLGTSERIIFEALERVKTKDIQDKEYIDNQKMTFSKEEYLMGLLLFYPKMLDKIITQLEENDFDDKTLARKIYKYLKSCYTKHESDNLLKNLEKELSDDEIKKVKFLIFEVETKNHNTDEAEIEDELKQSLIIIKKAKRDKIKIDFAREISLAEQSGDIVKVKQLLKELQNAIKEKNN